MFGDVCGVFYGAGRCWSAARRVSGLEGNAWSLKMCICCQTLAPCLHQPIATTTESASPAAVPRGMTTKDKKIELMVLTSTRPVAPHIAGCISSVAIYIIRVEVQMVLISTVSTCFLSSLSSSFSCLDLVHKDSTRSLHLRPLPC